jgi:hypothetical protein
MVDFSTSGSLQLARQVDPSGERTLLCVTTVDEGEGRGWCVSASDCLPHQVRHQGGRDAR